MTLKQLKSELAKINKGCGKEFEYTNDYSPHYINCGNRFANTDIILCPTCQAKKQGIILGAKMMIDTEFLEEIKKCVECEGCRRIIDKKIADLKELKEELGEE